MITPDMPLPGADEWDTGGFPVCLGARAHSDYCGCRPLITPNPLQDKEVS